MKNPKRIKRTDEERLDWLDKNDCVHCFDGDWCVLDVKQKHWSKYKKTLRQAIDAAMEGDK